MELTKERLEEMAAVDIRTVDISTLTDLRDIEIDTSLPVEKKLNAFARQTNNVYVNRIGDYVVKVRFQKDGASIDDKMAEYLQHSLMLVTALNPHIGYENAAKTAKKAYQDGISLKEACVALGFLSAEEFDAYVIAENMV